MNKPLPIQEVMEMLLRGTYELCYVKHLTVHQREELGDICACLTKILLDSHKQRAK